MNKFKKVLCALIIVCTLFSLSGCIMSYDYMLIDEALESHAIFTDESHKVISYKDKNFLRYNGNSKFDIDNDSNGYVTEADVPALLASQYGDHFYINTNKNIIKVISDSSDTTSIFYIREDCFNELITTIETGKDLYYCYDKIDEDYNITHTLATEEQKNAILATISTPSIPLDEYKSFGYDYTALYRCDKTMSIIAMSYFICEDDYGNLVLSTNYKFYYVPEIYKSTILEMTDKLDKTEKTFTDM